MTEFTTSAIGDRVAYDLYGSGPAVIFIAGAGPSRAFDTTTTETAALAAENGVTTVVYDRLGRNESPVTGDTHLDRELEAISALIEVAGGPAVLVGHSSGCTIALYAATHGLPVSGLILWEAPIGGIVGGAGDWAAEVGRRISAGDREGALAHYMKDMPPEWLEGARQSPMFGAMLAQIGSYRADGESLAWAESAPLADLLGGLDIPVEALYGEQTMPLMRDAADRLVAAIPGATQKAMSGANHSWEASAMADEVAAFAIRATMER